MPRQPRFFKPDYCYHITTRCNNREFKLSRRECREVFLYAIKKAFDKFKFKLYALCIRGFCKRYKPQPKPDKSYHWASKLLPKVINCKSKKTSPGQMRLPWVEWEIQDLLVRNVADQFVVANCYVPKIAMKLFNDGARYWNY